MDVGLDVVAVGSTGLGNTTCTVDIDVAVNPDRGLILFSAGGSLITGVIIGVSGHGGTWAEVGGTDGAATLRGSCWKNTNPSTGLATITVTFAGVLTSSAVLICYSLYNVNQTSQTSGYTGAATGSLVVPTAAGDMCVSALFNVNDTPAVTGCTDVEDVATFGVFGYGAAHCTDASSVTFSWSHIEDGIGMAVNVKQVGSAAIKVGSMLVMFQ